MTKKSCQKFWRMKIKTFLGNRSNCVHFPRSPKKILEIGGKSETGGKMHHCLRGDGRPCPNIVFYIQCQIVQSPKSNQLCNSCPIELSQNLCYDEVCHTDVSCTADCSEMSNCSTLSWNLKLLQDQRHLLKNNQEARCHSFF